jgi:hypothetical protein
MVRRTSRPCKRNRGPCPCAVLSPASDNAPHATVHALLHRLPIRQSDVTVPPLCQRIVYSKAGAERRRCLERRISRDAPGFSPEQLPGSLQRESAGPSSDYN